MALSRARPRFLLRNRGCRRESHGYLPSTANLQLLREFHRDLYSFPVRTIDFNNGLATRAVAVICRCASSKLFVFSTQHPAAVGSVHFTRVLVLKVCDGFRALRGIEADCVE